MRKLLALAAVCVLPVFALDVEKDAAGRIVAVDLTNSWITDAGMAQIGALAGLERLNLAHTRITDIGLEHLKKLANVKELSCYYAEYITDDGIAHLRTWSKLERLNLRGTKVTSKVFEHVARLTSLRSLDVAYSQVDDEGFEHLAALPNLERLALGGNRMNGSALPLLKTVPSLIDLDVGGIQRADSGLWGLALTDANIERISELTGLRRLSLNGANLADRGLDKPGQPEAIRGGMRDLSKLARLAHLEKLDLSRTPISSEGLQALAEMPMLRELRLGFAGNIDDAAAAALIRTKHLEVLYLSGTAITGKTLTALSGAKQLRELDVSGCRLSAAEIAEFRTARPDCRLTATVPTQ